MGLESYEKALNDIELDPTELDYNRPFRVIVADDCRNESEIEKTGSLALQKGWCIGMFAFPDMTIRKPMGIDNDYIATTAELENKSPIKSYTPLIQTDTGHFIWGLECFWADIYDEEFDPEIITAVSRFKEIDRKMERFVELYVETEYFPGFNN